MSLEIGQMLGPYEVVAALGAGGMGEVYRARDTRLDRDVAIKVLPAHLTHQDTARQRLEREAKAVCALSHPHICTLYDVGHEGDLDYLVIEYLEGETLAQRLERDTLSIAKIMEYAVQIADALDKAHRQGVLHRDLKPGNVMLTPRGAMLLDFGLAKSIAGPGGTSNLTVAPTVTSPLTAEGSIVGTFRYMAPELLEGQEADVRSDIFAFGTLLFEMITGKPAFDGRTQAGLIAAIIEREPAAVTSLQPLAPPALDRLVRTCLAKDPEERRQSMHDVLLDLKWIAEAGSQAGVPVPVTRRRQHRARLAWSLAALFAVASLALAWALWMRPIETPPRIVSQLLPPQGSSFARDLALSPDGRRLTFTAIDEDGLGMLWVRQLDSGISRKLPGTESARLPFWSPDSQSIAFFAEGELRRIPVSGESSLKVCNAPFGLGGTWNEAGVIVFSPAASSGLHRVDAAGGESTELLSVEDHLLVAPFFLGDGNRFLYILIGRDNYELPDLRVGSLDGSTDAELGPTELAPAVVGGHLLYGREEALIAQPFDEARLQSVGDPRVIAEPVGDYTASASGMLAYVSEPPLRRTQLTGYDRQGQEQVFVVSPNSMDDLAISPDGERLAMQRSDPQNPREYDVWTYDLSRDVFTRVTFDGAADDPVWSPDGKWIIYSRNPGLYRVRSNGAGQPELILDSDVDDVCHDWSRDGSQVLFSRAGEGDQLDLWSLAIGPAAEPRAVLDGKFTEFQAEFSPDGRWLAYTSAESGELQVHVMNWPDLTEKWQVSTAGGGMPRWRADGRELYYISLDRELIAVEIGGGTSGFRVGSERVLFATRTDPDSRSTDFVVTQEGTRFLFLELPPDVEGGKRSISLVQEFLRPADGG